MAVPAAWRECLWRERAVWVALACVLGCGTVAATGIGPEVVTEYAVDGLFVCAPVFLATAIWAGAFRCPRCGHTYSVRLGPGQFPDRKASSRNCLHCWLPKWADPDRVVYEEIVDESGDW
jgi:hypothetical protein